MKREYEVERYSGEDELERALNANYPIKRGGMGFDTSSWYYEQILATSRNSGDIAYTVLWVKET